MSVPRLAYIGDPVVEVTDDASTLTTDELRLRVAGQQRINLIWEITQSTVTLLVVLANMAVAVFNGIRQHDVASEHPVILSSALFLILGFYYSRTNHSAIGGVGQKPVQPYLGR